MAIRTMTVAEYFAAAKPFPAGDAVTIADTGAIISGLTVAQITALKADGVDAINATDDALSFSYAQIEALSTVTLSVDDKVKLFDTTAVIKDLTQARIDVLTAKGVDVIGAVDEKVQISTDLAERIAKTDLTFEDTDLVTINSANKLQMSASDISKLSAKGVDLIDLSSAADKSVSVEAAIGLADSKIKFMDGQEVAINDFEKEFSKLTPAQIQALVAKGLDVIDVFDGKLNFSYDHYAAMGAATFKADDTVAVTFNLADLATMTDLQLANMTTKGVDTRVLSLDLSDLAYLSDNQLATIEGRGVDVLVLSASGAALAALDANRIVGLRARGIDRFDASDDVLSLSFTQYSALGTIALAKGDTVSMSATIADMAGITKAVYDDMILTKGIDSLVLEDGGQALKALTVEQIQTLSGDAIDATDNVLTLSKAQFDAFRAQTFDFTQSDQVTVTDTGAALSALSGDDIARFANAKIDVLDATDNRISWNQNQYKVLGTVKLATNDVVSVVSSTDLALTNGGTTLTLTGNALRGTGNNFVNTLTGTAKNNTLSALGGDDKLDGGYGKDVLSGGSGKDTFVFKDRLSKTANYDTITDYRASDDKVFLDNKSMSKLGSGSSSGKQMSSKFFKLSTQKQDRDDYLIYDKGKGVLYYDSNADKSGGRTEIVKFSNKIALTSKEFFII